MIQERFAGFVLVGIQAFLLAEYSGQIWVALVVAGLALIGVYMRVPLALWSVFGVGAMSMVASFYAAIVIPPEIQNEWLIPGQYVVAICRGLLIVQLLEFFRRRPNPGLSLGFYGLALAGMLVAFCRWESPRSTAMFYLAAIGFALVFLFPTWIGNAGARQGNSRQPGDASPRSSGVFGTFSVLLATVAAIGIALGTGYAADTAKKTVGLARFFVSGTVVDYIEQQQTRIAFATTGNFGDVSRVMQTAPDQIALSITCDVPPGYLRGKVFTDLVNVNTGWREYSNRVLANRGMRKLEQLDEADSERGFMSTAGGQLRLFEVSANESELRRVDVSRSPNHWGKCYFVPLHTSYFESASGMVVANRHEVIVEGPPDDQVYFAYVPRLPEAVMLTAEMEQSCTRLSRQLDSQVYDLARQVCADCETDAERVAAVENYFQDNYEYSLDRFVARGTDRLSYFILQKPPSYCEYFASAAVMFLRACGVPARYVTGFATVHPSSSDENDGEMWEARNRDAHAWAEAYDRESQQWVIVEATPGADFPKKLWKDGPAGEGAGAGGIADEELEEEDDVQLSWWTKTWLAIRGFFIRNSYLPNLVGSCILIGAVIWYFLRRNWRSEAAGRLRTAELRNLERRLKRLDLVRPPAETLHQFARRIEEYDGPRPDWLRGVPDKFRDYARLRYTSA